MFHVSDIDVHQKFWTEVMEAVVKDQQQVPGGHRSRVTPVPIPNKSVMSGWTSSLRQREISIRVITEGQPFCAGVLHVLDGRLLCTLSSEGMAAERQSGWRLGGVGGGQEPGETIWECARREAREELGHEVDLVSSPVTYVHDAETGEVGSVHCVDFVAPFCLERRPNADPDKPFRPGLPTGPFTYFGLFLMNSTHAHLFRPGDDAEALLWMPLAHWEGLNKGVTLGDVIDFGGKVIAPRKIDLLMRIWLPPYESLVTVAPLLCNHPELER
jgi:8-oxo-dGTP pyrophosphatase MutT (NUDIX family)